VNTDLLPLYLHGAPALDAVFVSARAHVYNPGDEWIHIDGPGRPVLVRVARTVRGLKIRTLESGFGADFRPFTQSADLDIHRADELVAAIHAIDRWDMAELTLLSPSEANLLEAALARRRLHPATFPFNVSAIAGCDGYEQYLSRRGSSVNKNQRSHLQRAARHGYAFRTELRWEEIVRVLDAREDRFGGADYTRIPRFRTFLKEFRLRMASAGRLLEVGMFSGDTLVGYQIAFRTGPVLHMYQTAFDPAHAERRAGSLALEKAIELGLGTDVSVIDLMNDSPHLAHFATHTLELRRVAAVAHTIRGRLLRQAFRLRAGRRAGT
jgi:Acetyltransferase (GNAT) domain